MQQWRRHFPRMLAGMRARARVSYTDVRDCTSCTRACVQRGGCGVSAVSIYFLIAAKLSWPSWQVPSLFLPRERNRVEREQEGPKVGGDVAEERVGEEGEDCTLPHTKKDHPRRRLISEALPPAPFKASANPRGQGMNPVIQLLPTPFPSF